MDCKVLPFFVFFGFGFDSIPACLVPRREYHYLDLRKSWTDARRYCRDKHSDLATFETAGDFDKLSRSHLSDERVWIGLHDDPKSWREEMGQERNSWRWSATGKPSTTGYQNWDEGEPNNQRGDQLCVLVLQDGFWAARPCHFPRGFICYDAANPPGQSRYVVNTTKVTWKQAQESCREHHTDLVTIENDQEQSVVFTAKLGMSAAHWTGLYRVPWAWADRGGGDFTNFKTNEPDNADNNQYCVAEQPDHQWSDENCDSLFPFLCHKDIRPGVTSTVLRVKMKSNATLSEPAVHAQLLHQLGELLRIHNNSLCGLKWMIPPKKDEEGGSSP